MTAETLAVAPRARRQWSPYPEYRSADYVWIAQIPAHWGMAKLKRIARFVGGGTPSKEDGSLWGGTIPWVSPKDMKTERITDTEDRITEHAIRQSSTRMVSPGTVLVVVRSGILRHSIPVAINDVAVALNQDMKAIILDDSVLPEYLAALIRGHQQSLLVGWRKSGATVESIEHDLLTETMIPIPPLDEQRAIAAFLDRETAKIDALIEKKQRLIELLQEKRTALISHSVTKGLDPTAPTRDSGIPWIGQIPAHWEVIQLRRKWTVIDCKHRTAQYYDTGLPIVSTTEVKPGRLDLSRTRITSEEEYLDLIEGGRRPIRGDIIYSRNASVGSAAYVDTNRPFCMGQDVCRITSADEDQLFLAYQLNSPPVLGQLDGLLVGSTFKRINVAEIRNFWISCPPVEEQRRISEYLDSESGKFKQIIEMVQKHIGLLHEHRTALISAAVTGKIDVRGEVGA